MPIKKNIIYAHFTFSFPTFLPCLYLSFSLTHTQTHTFTLPISLPITNHKITVSKKLIKVLLSHTNAQWDRVKEQRLQMRTTFGHGCCVMNEKNISELCEFSCFSKQWLYYICLEKLWSWKTFTPKKLQIHLLLFTPISSLIK